MKPIPLKPAFSPLSQFWMAARDIYLDLRGYGFDNPLAIGILANFEMESGFSMQAVGDNGLSFNLEQWQAARIVHILRATGINVKTDRSIANVVKACVWELQNVEPYMDHLAQMKAAKTAEEAASLFCEYIEGAGAEDAKQRRALDATFWTIAISAHPEFFSAAA